MSKKPFVATGDENEDHTAFERYVGGPDRAFQLLYLYQRCDEGVFREAAKRRGYSDNEIEALLAIQ